MLTRFLLGHHSVLAKATLPFLALALACNTHAQPTWRFHLAFEDGTGARDTIWMVYDTTATTGSDFIPVVDYTLGEGGLQIDSSMFNVFTWNWDGDSTKTHAYPYTAFPVFDGTTIDAINWIPPMTITWDTSLFHAPYLPYDQGSFGIAIMDGLAFSAYSNHPELGFGIYDMLISNSITVDFLWDYLFQFSIYFGDGDGVGLPIHVPVDPAFSIGPNPVRSMLHVRSADELVELRIFDLSGRNVKSVHAPTPIRDIDIASLAPGAYILLARSTPNHLYHGQFQKVD